MANLRRRVADRDITIELSEHAMKALASEGYDPQFGARPLKRVIQNRIENALATRLLTGEFAEGDSILIDYELENFVFRTTNGGRETREGEDHSARSVKEATVSPGRNGRTSPSAQLSVRLR